MTPKIKALDLRPSKPKPAVKPVKPASAQRQYAAAQYTAMTGDWNPAKTTVNEEISSSAALVTARMRQLVRDNPHFSRAVKLTSTYIVGSGIRYQSQVKTPDGVLINKLNQYIEDKYNAWLENIDVSGRLHGYDLQTLCCDQLSECGEFIMIRRIDSKRSDGVMPLRYQIIEPDALSSIHSEGFGGVVGAQSSNGISQGIEYDRMTYKPIRYHFMEYGIDGQVSMESFALPASQVIHRFRTLRPGQIRGISDFASGILLADAYRSYFESELSRKAMAARWLAFVKSPDPLKFQSGLGNDTTDSGARLEDMDNATIQYLNPMEDIVLPTVPTDTGLSDFSRIVLQMYSVATGIPYEALTQDYGSMSFSTAKIKRTDLKNEIKPAQRRFIRWQCQPIMEDFFKYGILSGYLDLSEAAGLNYAEGIWQPPGFEPVDPLREVKAVIEEIKAGLRSPQEYIGIRGGDPGEVLAEISEFKALSKSYGLNFDAALTQASTMMANAPSKIDSDGEANEQG